MLALAGYPLGVKCMFLDRSEDAPGAQVSSLLRGELGDPQRLKALAAQNDVLTFDWENVPGRALALLGKRVLVRPPPAALEASQDRLREKALFTSLRIPVAAHAAVDSWSDLSRAIRTLGARGILKTRRLGYDGKGQHVIRRPQDAQAAWAAMGGADLIYEKLQPFSREVSILGARAPSGRIVYYPLSANTHSGGVLRFGVAPYASRSLERAARRHLKNLL